MVTSVVCMCCDLELPLIDESIISADKQTTNYISSYIATRVLKGMKLLTFH